jgi:hypothetical protein
MKTNIENPRSKTKSRKHPEFCIPEFCGDSTHVFSSTRTAAFVRILVSASSIMRVGTSSTLVSLLEPLPLLCYPLLDQARLRGSRASRRVQFNWGNLNLNRIT